MARGLTYADAAVLLGGGPETKVVAALDKLCGGALLVASVFNPVFVLSLFDAKAELFRLSSDLIGGLGEQVRGLNRYDRTRRLEAAHAVAVLAAFFECVSQIDLPNELRPTKSEQLALATGAVSARDLSRSFLRTPPPVPMPHLSSEQIKSELGVVYEAFVTELWAFFSGLEAWEQLPAPQRESVSHALRDLPGQAVARFETLFRRLALDFPEFGFWANQLDHQATRAQVDIAFAGLATMLDSLRIGRDPAGVRADLSRSYQAVLRRPGVTFGDLHAPRIEQCYVNPNFRVGEPRIDEITSATWWDDQPLRTDLQNFLIGYLTSPVAVEAPLVVLGHPGAGKSLLTQMLAARLPASDFLTVRVPLREVPADADLQTQIEMVVRSDTGASTTWPELVATAGDALPVVLLDGFDELLQATGQSQSNYLERIAAFQQREAELGRPVAVLVTSRLTVADRARPVSGMITLLLDAFDDDQIALWLDAWNECNADTLAARRIRPLPPDVALRYKDLARQPLLLLLLALYDSDHNGLHGAAHLNESELYERLLTGFTRREVLKAGQSLTDRQLDEAVATEMLHLSVVAFAMFNRNQLWVTEAELKNDLDALLDGPIPADLLVGRFYFVYVAQALHDQKQLKTYEFLHATFGEFLVARLVVDELTTLVAAAEAPTTRGRPSTVDDQFLHALLSFTPLTMRGTVVSFADDMLRGREDADRVTSLLLKLFRVAMEPRRTQLDRYCPASISVPARVANYAANLFLLLAISTSEVTSAQLFPDADDHAIEWTRTAQLWCSQLPIEGWRNLVDQFTVHREWADGRRMIRIVTSLTSIHELLDPQWTYNYPPESWQSWRAFVHDDGWRITDEADFTGGRLQEVAAHNLEPFMDGFDRMLTSFHDMRGEGMVSAARALISLWLASGQDLNADVLAAQYEICLRIAANGFAPDDDRTRRAYRSLVLHRLKYDAWQQPRGWIRKTADAIEAETPYENQDALDFLTELRQNYDLD